MGKFEGLGYTFDYSAGSITVKDLASGEEITHWISDYSGYSEFMEKVKMSEKDFYLRWLLNRLEES